MGTTYFHSKVDFIVKFFLISLGKVEGHSNLYITYIGKALSPPRILILR